MALTMWLLGAVVAATGSAVYLEYGTVSALPGFRALNTEVELQTLPRSGGEKNYLEYVYKHPRFMATCVCAMYGLFIVSNLPYHHTSHLTGH